MKEWIVREGKRSGGMYPSKCYEKIQDLVRCKECKWADWYKTADGKQFCYCMETGNGGRTADDFCSRGEREGE